VKKGLFAATLVAALTITAVAADKKPPVSQHLAGSTAETKLAPPGTPPTYCSPCLFYGGDLNTTDSNAAGLSDENTLLVLGSSTYTAYDVPNGVTAGVTGILVNVQASVNFDPQTAAYDVRTGISEGNGGTSIASGTGVRTPAFHSLLERRRVLVQRHSAVHQRSDRWKLLRRQDFHLEHNTGYERRIRERAASRLDLSELVLLRVHLGQLVRFVAGIEFLPVPGSVVWFDGNSETGGVTGIVAVCSSRSRGAIPGFLFYGGFVAKALSFAQRDSRGRLSPHNL
jgi:hypothetical protein